MFRIIPSVAIFSIGRVVRMRGLQHTYELTNLRGHLDFNRGAKGSNGGAVHFLIII